MITRNVMSISVSVVLLVVSVALVLTSMINRVPGGSASQSSQGVLVEDVVSLCSYAPAGVYMLCCENEAGEDIDCTEKTFFKASEKVTIIVNPSILQNKETPFLLCENSDLSLTLDTTEEVNEDNVQSVCAEIGFAMENFVIRKEGFVPSDHSKEGLTLLQLSVGQDERFDPSKTILDITRSFAR